VRIVQGPDFQGDRGQAEYAAQRQFAFRAEVERVSPNRDTDLVSFQETLSYAGGQPMRTMCRAVNRPPIDQVTWPYTEFTCVQSGSAVGLLAWPFGGPNIGPPLRFPAVLLREAMKVDPSGPDRVGPTTYKNYSVRWSASFASALPLIAAPTLWR
jgi:hypothetical protein